MATSVSCLYLLLVLTSYSAGTFSSRRRSFDKTPNFPDQSYGSDENCPLLAISDDEMTRAFDYARQQAELRQKSEDAFVETDYLLPLTGVTTELRLLGGILETDMQQHRIQEQLEDVTRYLVKEKGLTETQAKVCLRNQKLPENQPVLQECRAHRETNCQPNLKYRTADSSCNNLKNPNWGRSHTCYGRIMKEEYADGISKPRMGVGNENLPNVRLLSSNIDPDVNVTSEVFSHMTVGFGQFLAHDLAGTVFPVAGEKGARYTCCPQNSSITFPSSCFPFEIYKNDNFYSRFGMTCTSFVRAAACSSDCTLGPRRQLNGQTGFIDASVIYGTTEEEMNSLRTKDPEMRGGLLFQETQHGNLLPASFAPDFDQCSKTMTNSCLCFQSGDGRVNLQPALTSMHTIWHHTHNDIAKTLRDQYPDKSDEIIFQETRRIVGATFQMITYKEFLPLVIGSHLTEFFGLNVKKDGFTTYIESVDPTVFAEFSTAPFRFGHSTAQNFYRQYEDNGKRLNDIYLGSNQFHPEAICEGNLDSLVRGLFRQGFQNVDRFFSSSVTNHLVQVPGSNYGPDLVSINIQRGRETGLPPYIDLVKYCYGITITTFEDLRELMSTVNWQKLKRFYNDPRDIDTYIGGFLETHIDGAMVGPTFGCLIGFQFQKLKDGDRYFFQHTGQDGSFTAGQLAEVRKTSLAQIICHAIKSINRIPLNVFLIVSETNPMKRCEEIPAANFSNWFNL